MRSRFARLRVRPAHRDEPRSEPRAGEWLVIEWPHPASGPTKYWLSTLPGPTSIVELVRVAKLRWRIERDYQELKDALGLDHFEGRGWRGFYHHGALCIAAYTFRRPRARPCPPLGLWPSSAPLAFPKVSSREALPGRPERNGPTPIATMYHGLARALLQRQPCRACGHARRAD